jgi:hypothetical protein
MRSVNGFHAQAYLMKTNMVRKIAADELSFRFGFLAGF